MPRRKRHIIPGLPYHLTARGNHARRIFNTNCRRAMYMSLLTHGAEQIGIQVASFALMNNHIHLAAVAPTSTAFSEWMEGVQRDYSRWLNMSRDQTGHNWDRRFYSTLMDEAHCEQAIRYIEQNPVAAKLVAVPWNWKWSSAAWHAGIGPKPRIITLDLRPSGISAEQWKDLLITESPEEFRQKLRDCRRKNSPLASDAWIAKLEAQTGLCLRPRGRGRPKKDAAVNAPQHLISANGVPLPTN